MPIRLNLLAEAQAMEEMRRRDPVKRGIWIAGCLVVMMLLWSISLYFRTIIVRGNLHNLETRAASQTNEYQSVLEDQRDVTVAKQRLDALQQLTANRFLYGSLLNALQKCTVDYVQLIRFRVDQSYIFVEEIKGRTNAGHIMPGKPASVTEKIVVALDAKDFSSNPGDQIGKYREAVAANPFFEKLVSKTNDVRLARLSPPTSVPGEPAFISFTLECRFPDKTR